MTALQGGALHTAHTKGTEMTASGTNHVKGAYVELIASTSAASQ